MQLKPSFQAEGGVRIEVADWRCGQDLVAGTLFVPSRARRLGVVFVPGGAQIRVGSHRMGFALAQTLAASGYPGLIFDWRGNGDSDGDLRPYYDAHDQIRTAVDKMRETQPSIAGVVLWGLCDGAAAGALYASTDGRVRGLIMVNPWLESDRSQARSRLSGYYLRRLQSWTMWRDLIRGHVNPGGAVHSLAQQAARALGFRVDADQRENAPSPLRVAQSLAEFEGPTHVVLSGNDVTAKTFALEMSRHAEWKRIAGRSGFQQTSVPDADHTFASGLWYEQLEAETLGAIRRFDESAQPSGQGDD